MKILYLLIPLGFVVMGVALWAIIWAVKMASLKTLRPAHRILMDDDDPMVPGFDKGADKPASPNPDLNNKPD